jgi:hypothetical protein
MTPEQQRIAIAEACGYKRGENKNCPYDYWYKSDGIVYRSCDLPNYLNDLNAMHEAEKILLSKFDNWHTPYLRELSRKAYPPFTATASQRAEAFLKTLNLWTS